MSVIGPRPLLVEYLHFNTVDKMNVAMADKDYELAGRIFEDYVWRENYSVKRYNSLEAKMCLISASHMYEYGYRKARMSWLDDPKVKKTVAEYSKAYYPIVEAIVPALGEEYEVRVAHREFELGSINDRVIRNIYDSNCLE